MLPPPVLAVVAALFVGFNATYFQGQARYLYPAVAVLGVVVARGLGAWLKDNRAHTWVVLVGSLGLLCFAAYSQITDGFAVRVSRAGTPVTSP